MLAAPAIRFSGTVRDSTGGLVPGAYVGFNNRGTHADSEGRFSFTAQPGTSRLLISGWTMSASVENFRLDDDTTRDFVLPVVPVDVNVKDGTGRGVPGMQVTVTSVEGPAAFELIPGKPTVVSNSLQAHGDAGGHARVMALPTKADLRIYARADSDSSYVSRAVGPLDAPLTVDLTYSTGHFTGTLRHTDGAVPPGTSLYLWREGDTSGGGTAVNPDGTFSLDAPPGRYHLALSGSYYDWEDDEDGSSHDGYSFSATFDDFVLNADRHVDLRLPAFQTVNLHVVDPNGAPVGAAVAASANKSAVELLPGTTWTVWVDNRWETDGVAVLRALPGADLSVHVTPYDSRLGVYDGTVSAAENITVRLPNPGTVPGTVPVRFINAKDPSICAYIVVSGPEGSDDRYPGGDTCTLSLAPGEHRLSMDENDEGDSGDYTTESYSLSADYTVSGPATLSLTTYPAQRAQVDIVNASGDPVLGTLVLKGAPGPIDLGSGIKGTGQVANYYEDGGDGGPTYYPPMFGPTVFSGEFQPDGGPHVTFTGLKLAGGGHVTLVQPDRGAGLPDLPDTNEPSEPTIEEPTMVTPGDPPANTANDRNLDQDRLLGPRRRRHDLQLRRRRPPQQHHERRRRPRTDPEREGVLDPQPQRAGPGLRRCAQPGRGADGQTREGRSTRCAVRHTVREGLLGLHQQGPRHHLRRCTVPG